MKPLLILTAALLAVPMLIVVLTAGAEAPAATGGLAGEATALARRDIPPRYLAWYMDAAQTCPGLPWNVLAGIGKVESDHGRYPASRQPNFAGARGPMQFLPATFAAYKIDGDHDGDRDIYDPADAIFSAAHYLCASGADEGNEAGLRKAIFAYNHAAWYVDLVLSWAAKYATTGGTARGAAARAIAFAKQQLGEPYVWGAVGPDSWDCSGLTWAAYKHAGITIGRTTWEWRQTGPRVNLNEIAPGDLLYSAGSDGTPDRPGHVVMNLGSGQVIQAPRSGDVVKISPLDRSKITIATRPAELGSR